MTTCRSAPTEIAEGALPCQSARKRNSSTFSLTAYSWSDLIEMAGAAAEGIIYPSHFNPQSRNHEVRKFQQAYEAQYGHLPEGFAALAYDGLRIIVDALKSSHDNPALIRDYLYSVTNWQGVTGLTSFDTNGDVIKLIVIKTVHNGQFIARE